METPAREEGVMAEKKIPKRKVVFRGPAGDIADSIMFRGRIYHWVGNHFLKRNAIKSAKKLMEQGYRVRLVKAMGLWRIYKRTPRFFKVRGKG